MSKEQLNDLWSFAVDRQNQRPPMLRVSGGAIDGRTASQRLSRRLEITDSNRLIQCAARITSADRDPCIGGRERAGARSLNSLQGKPGLAMSRSSGVADQLHGSTSIRIDAETFLVEFPQCILGICIATRGCLVEPEGRFGIVMLYAPSRPIGHPESVARARIPTFGRTPPDTHGFIEVAKQNRISRLDESRVLAPLTRFPRRACWPSTARSLSSA